MSTPLSPDALWADHDWVADSERRRGRLAWIGPIAFTLVGGAFYFSGFIAITSSIGPVLLLIGLVLFLIATVLAVTASPYRRVRDVVDLATVFHISPVYWEEGERVTLEVARCRKRQFIAERRWGRRSRLVYFFAQRPAQRHARGQTLAGKRRSPRYLYELKVLQPVERLYKRESAMGTPSNLVVEVVRRQTAESISNGRRRAVIRFQGESRGRPGFRG